MTLTSVRRIDDGPSCSAKMQVFGHRVQQAPNSSRPQRVKPDLPSSHTVAGREDPLRADDGGAAEELVVLPPVHRHHPGPRPRLHFVPAHHPQRVLVVGQACATHWHRQMTLLVPAHHPQRVFRSWPGVYHTMTQTNDIISPRPPTWFSQLAGRVPHNDTDKMTLVPAHLRGSRSWRDVCHIVKQMTLLHNGWQTSSSATPPARPRPTHIAL